MAGWIKIYRDIDKHWISQDLKKLGWWVYLLYKASYEDNKTLVGHRVIEVKRGQLVVSLSDLAERFEVTKPTVIKFLDLLEQEGMIIRGVDRKITIITICNYDSYQGLKEQQVTDSYTDSFTDGLPIGYPTKEDKEDKEINNTNPARTHEGKFVSWDASTEQGFADTFKGTGAALPMARAVGKSGKEILTLLEVYMATRQLKGKGHKDYNEFVNLFKWHLENGKIRLPDTPNESKVITGTEILNIYG